MIKEKTITVYFFLQYFLTSSTVIIIASIMTISIDNTIIAICTGVNVGSSIKKKYYIIIYNKIRYRTDQYQV